MAKDKLDTTVDLDAVECKETVRVWWKHHDALWVYDPSNKTESHDPMDRCGGPYRISGIVNPADSGNYWFIGCLADCYFPPRYAVRADSWEEAYEIFTDWSAEHLHTKIEPADYADYAVETDNPTCSFTSSGEPVDTEGLHLDGCRLARIDFVRTEETLARYARGEA